jgi:hypothetical protein
MRFPRTFLASTILGVLLVACARLQSPVLYPNAHLQQVGNQQAEKDIEECRQFASHYVPSTVGKDVAKNTGIGTAGGAAVGAVGGAVSGSAGRGAAIGAATGATAGVLSGIAKPTVPSLAYKGFVDRCLRERGYEVAGWQ